MRDHVPLTVHNAPRFDIYDQGPQMLEYLNEHGYCVVKAVANVDEVARAKDQFWNHLENTTRSLTEKGKAKVALDRNDISTWKGKSWLPNQSNGIMGQYGFNHSEFLWNTRLLPGVRRAFELIWETDDLIVSFDAGNAFRPWRHNPEFLTSGGWWHVDQNGKIKGHEGKTCVQGLVTFYDATADTGGFCCIPGSHLDFNDLCNRSSVANRKIDFIGLDTYDPILQVNDGILVGAKAGDLILWDSRTVHCNTPALTVKDFVYNAEEANKEENKELIRLCAYTCMLPKSHANEEILLNRKKTFMLRLGTTHWPTQNCSYLKSKTSMFEDQHTEEYLRQFKPEQLRLVGYAADEIPHA